MTPSSLLPYKIVLTPEVFHEGTPGRMSTPSSSVKSRTCYTPTVLSCPVPSHDPSTQSPRQQADHVLQNIYKRPHFSLDKSPSRVTPLGVCSPSQGVRKHVTVVPTTGKKLSCRRNVPPTSLQSLPPKFGRGQKRDIGGKGVDTSPLLFSIDRSNNPPVDSLSRTFHNDLVCSKTKKEERLSVRSPLSTSFPLRGSGTLTSNV